MKEIFMIAGSLIFVIGLFILRFKFSEKINANTLLLVRLLNKYCSDEQPHESTTIPLYERDGLNLSDVGQRPNHVSDLIVAFATGC